MSNFAQRSSIIIAALSAIVASPTMAHTQETATPAATTAPPVPAQAPITKGVNHIALTVTDLDASVAFFVDGLGWRRAGGFPDYPSVFVTDGAVFVTLWRATDPANAIAFDRKNNVGLHHLAFTVPDVETLDELHATLLTWPGVKIEFAPEPNGGGPTIHMIVREPSGNRIEFAVPGGRSRADAQ